MHTFPIILFVFLIGCGGEGEYNTLELVWEQKTDSTKTALDKAPKTVWLEIQGKELMQKAEQFYHDKLHKKKEEPIILNTIAPEWTVSDWLNSKPLILNELHGKVVLIRWWTGPTCPYCINSAVALNEFHETYKNDGLQVLGFYHNKSKSPIDKDSIITYTQKLGFKFPVAIDHEWETLNDWWVKMNPGKWTSVSFLLDRKGIVRYIHPGGQYVKGDGEYKKLQQKIEKLLKEKM